MCTYHFSKKKKKIVEWICGNGIAEIRGKKIVAICLWQCHCWNKGKKFVAIVAMSLPKMGGKKIVVAEIWGGIKKKKVLHPPYFYNIFTTNHMWLVIISLNLNLTLRLLF